VSKNNTSPLSLGQGKTRSPTLAADKQQEVQLLQTDRVMLRVIKYFTKSLKVTDGHSK